MPVIKVDNQQYSLRPGPNRLGAGAEADVRLSEDAALGVQAIVDVGLNAQAVIRRAGLAASVRVNGIALVDPTPLMHGDKVEIAGQELLYAEDTKAGNTAFVSSADIAAIAQKRPGPARATSATGGRLVSLVDGKEYSVPSAGISIGRDASSGVVVPQNEVSRRHAEIVPVDAGYELRDFSANGVFVNGSRVEKSQVLSRSDIIQVGTEEFRFYADVRPNAPATPAISIPAAAVPAAPVVPPAPPDIAASPVAASIAAAPAAAVPMVPPAPPPAPSAPGVSASPAPDTGPRPVLASLEVTSTGVMKGHRYEIHVPLAHVGRGSHNDIVIQDDSVSDTHAKLQRRDDGWYLVDASSTNGTYLGGQRLTGERRLEGTPDIRFGGVKTIFRAVGVPAAAASGTRAIANVERPKPQPIAPKPQAPEPEPVLDVRPPVAAAPSAGLPTWVWIVVALAVLGAVALFVSIR